LKDYIIWFKSGQCISGTAKEDILTMLKGMFKDHKEGKEVISFPDMEGETYIDLDRIEAIGINDQFEEKQAGF
jgi:hypothetical protein